MLADTNITKVYFIINYFKIVSNIIITSASKKNIIKITIYIIEKIIILLKC